MFLWVLSDPVLHTDYEKTWDVLRIHYHGIWVSYRIAPGEDN